MLGLQTFETLSEFLWCAGKVVRDGAMYKLKREAIMSDFKS